MTTRVEKGQKRRGQGLGKAMTTKKAPNIETMPDVSFHHSAQDLH